MQSFKKTNSNKWLLRFKSILLYKQEKWKTNTKMNNHLSVCQQKDTSWQELNSSQFANAIETALIIHTEK